MSFIRIPFLCVSFFLMVFLFGCGSDVQEGDSELIIDGELEADESVEADAKAIQALFKNKTAKKRSFEAIKKSGVIRAVTLYSSTGYFLYRGQTMGFEFELLKKLADFYQLELEVIVAKNILDLLTTLNDGRADIVAYGLTITKNRKQFVDFSDYLYLSQQVLVQRKPTNWRKMKLHEIEDALISNNVELIGKTVSLRPNSASMHRLGNLMEELGDDIYIDTMPANYKTERLIEMVVDGEIEYTVADNNIASINASYYPELDIKVPVSFSQRIGWAVSKGSSDLLDALNNWLAQVKRKPDFNVIYDRYFENKKDFRKRIGDDYFSTESGKISQYDDLLKKYSGNIDWRLVSAIVYQESQFNPQAKSWAGAQGLMQLMPATAEELGVKDRSNPEDNIRGGTKYLKQIWDDWDEISDSIQRIKFTLASYNCGYYHVRDAARLAEKDQVDATLWDDHVEKYILKLSDPEYFNDPVVHYGYARGIEPFTYVFEIFERYGHYQKFIIE